MTIPLTLSHIIHAVTSGAARAAEILLHLTPEPRHNAEVAAYRLGYCAARTSGSRSTCAPPPRTSSIWLTPWHRPRSGPRPRASSRPAIRSGSSRTATDFDGPETRIAPHTRRGGWDSGVGGIPRRRIGTGRGSVSGAVRRTRSLNRDLIAVDEHEAAVVEPEGPPPRGIGEANSADLDCVADVAPSSTTVARLSFSVSGTPAPASRPRCAMRDCERWPDQQAYTCSSPAASIGRRASKGHRGRHHLNGWSRRHRPRPATKFSAPQTITGGRHQINTGPPPKLGTFSNTSTTAWRP